MGIVSQGCTVLGIRRLGRAVDAAGGAELPQSQSRYLPVTWHPVLGSGVGASGAVGIRCFFLTPDCNKNWGGGRKGGGGSTLVVSECVFTDYNALEPVGSLSVTRPSWS